MFIIVFEFLKLEVLEGSEMIYQMINGKNWSR